MAYKVSKNQPKKRDPSLKWDEVGPGLYDDGEVLIEVDDIFATVSFTTTWLENGAGVVIKGTARWVNADGSTHLTPEGQHVETQTSLTTSPLLVEAFGVEAITKELLLGLMGEPPELLNPDGTPTVIFSEEGKLNMSIKMAAKTVKSAREMPSTASILGVK